eukprot:1667747-Pleurochrysis_carterae.AAC.1
MSHAGVDGLHLIYLNIFKHLFNYTVHQPLPGAPAYTSQYCLTRNFSQLEVVGTDAKKKLVKLYLRENGFYSYDAAADDENPVMRWIGREVKRFLREATVHLPFLLRVAAVPDSVFGNL